MTWALWKWKRVADGMQTMLTPTRTGTATCGRRRTKWWLSRTDVLERSEPSGRSKRVLSAVVVLCIAIRVSWPSWTICDHTHFVFLWYLSYCDAVMFQLSGVALCVCVSIYVINHVSRFFVYMVFDDWSGLILCAMQWQCMYCRYMWCDSGFWNCTRGPRSRRRLWLLTPRRANFDRWPPGRVSDSSCVLSCERDTLYILNTLWPERCVNVCVTDAKGAMSVEDISRYRSVLAHKRKQNGAKWATLQWGSGQRWGFLILFESSLMLDSLSTNGYAVTVTLCVFTGVCYFVLNWT